MIPFEVLGVNAEQAKKMEWIFRALGLIRLAKFPNTMHGGAATQIFLHAHNSDEKQPSTS